MWPSIRDRGKVPATSIDDGLSVGLPTLFDIKISEGESALANPSWARWLIEATLFPIGRENRKNRMVFKMFSSFYPTILRIIFQHSFFIKKKKSDLTYLLFSIGAWYTHFREQISKDRWLSSIMNGQGGGHHNRKDCCRQRTPDDNWTREETLGGDL